MGDHGGGGGGGAARRTGAGTQLTRNQAGVAQSGTLAGANATLRARHQTQVQAMPRADRTNYSAGYRSYFTSGRMVNAAQPVPFRRGERQAMADLATL